MKNKFPNIPITQSKKQTQLELPNLSNQPRILRTAYSPKQRETISFPENSPFTKQSFRDECDINTIMKRYQFTGELPNLKEQVPQYLDVSGADFREQMEFIAGAKTMFEELPSAIRNRFDNDPAEFLDFCSHEKNRPELAELGLLKANEVSPIPLPQPTNSNQPEAPTAVATSDAKPSKTT